MANKWRRPMGCQCDLNTWFEKPGKPCEKFTGSIGAECYCVTCQHNVACHRRKPGRAS